jgi:hypothetical protein
LVNVSGNGNGHAKEQLSSGNMPHEPGFVEDETGTTIESGEATCRVEPQRGGRITRWQWRVTPPSGETKPQKAAGSQLIDLVDRAGGALIDHFMPLGTKPDEFASGMYREFGDFMEGEFRSQVVNTGGEIRMGLLRDGEIRSGKRVAEVRMAKSPALRPGAPDVSVLYRVINSSLRPLQILFAVEFNLFAPGLSNSSGQAGEEGYYLIDGERPEDDRLGSSGVSPNSTHAALVNPGGEMALQLGWDRECDLWRMPAQGDGPGVRLLAVWRIQLPPRDNWAMGLWMAPSK